MPGGSIFVILSRLRKLSGTKWCEKKIVGISNFTHAFFIPFSKSSAQEGRFWYKRLSFRSKWNLSNENRFESAVSFFNTCFHRIWCNRNNKVELEGKTTKLFQLSLILANFGWFWRTKVPLRKRILRGNLSKISYFYLTELNRQSKNWFEKQISKTNARITNLARFAQE